MRNKKGGEAENESNVAQNKNYFYKQEAEIDSI